MNPYSSEAWLTHGECSITNCVKFFPRYCQYCAADNFFKVILKEWCYKCCTQMIITWHQTKWMNSPQRRTGLFRPQKCYIGWPLKFWLYGKLLEEPAFILLMTLNLRKDGVIIYPLYPSEFIVSVKKMSDYSCFAESTPYSNLMSCYTTSCSMYWSVIMCWPVSVILSS